MKFTLFSSRTDIKWQCLSVENMYLTFGSNIEIGITESRRDTRHLDASSLRFLVSMPMRKQNAFRMMYVPLYLHFADF